MVYWKKCFSCYLLNAWFLSLYSVSCFKEQFVIATPFHFLFFKLLKCDKFAKDK